MLFLLEMNKLQSKSESEKTTPMIDQIPNGRATILHIIKMGLSKFAIQTRVV